VAHVTSLSTAFVVVAALAGMVILGAGRLRRSTPAVDPSGSVAMTAELS